MHASTIYSKLNSSSLDVRELFIQQSPASSKDEPSKKKRRTALDLSLQDTNKEEEKKDLELSNSQMSNKNDEFANVDDSGIYCNFCFLQKEGTLELREDFKRQVDELIEVTR